MAKATCQHCEKLFHYYDTAEKQAHPRVHRPKYCSMGCLLEGRNEQDPREQKVQDIFDCIKGGVVDFYEALFLWSEEDQPWSEVWDDTFHLEGDSPSDFRVVKND